MADQKRIQVPGHKCYVEQQCYCKLNPFTTVPSPPATVTTATELAAVLPPEVHNRVPQVRPGQRVRPRPSG